MPNGTDIGPHAAGLDTLFENLAADSWVGVNDGAAQADGNWDGSAFASGSLIEGGWFLNPPSDATNLPDVSGRVQVMFLTFTGTGLPEFTGLIGEPNNDSVFTTQLMFLEQLVGSISFGYVPNGGSIEMVTLLFEFPAPGAVALFGVAGLLGRRRRR
jgi:hypothetical protein